MEAHILAHFIDANPRFPFLCLTVSGGHTQLVLVENYTAMKIIGETIDDAAGEAFDKTAKMLGLPYPGGPLMDKLAKEGNPLAFKFASPKAPDLNFSFSGLKTSVLYFLQAEQSKNPDFIQQNIHNLCASIQHTIIGMLMRRLAEAVKQTGVKDIALAGGVSANSGLRTHFQQFANDNGLQAFIPKFEYCTDNAAMIAMVGLLKFKHNVFTELESEPVARWKIGS